MKNNSELEQLQRVVLILKDFKEELADLIHPKYFGFAGNHETYSSKGIVEIIETEDREHGYQQYPHCRILNDEDNYLYIHHKTELEMIDGTSPYEGEDIEYYVWQTTGYIGDDYSGYILLPLLDGKYWKISYSC